VFAVENFQARLVAQAVLKVAEQKDHAAFFEQVDALAQREADVGALRLRLERQHFADQPQRVAAPRFRRHVKFNLIAEHQEPDLVAVVRGAEGENRGELGRRAPLVPFRRTEYAGGGDVDQQQDGEFALLDVLFDVGRPHAGGDVPVDIADVVLDGILPDLLEFDAAPFEGAAVRTAGDLVDHAVRPDFEEPDLFGDFRRQHMSASFPGLRRPQFGEKARDHRVRIDIFGFGLVGEHDAVAEHVGRELLDVLRQHVGAFGQQRRPA